MAILTRSCTHYDPVVDAVLIYFQPGGVRSRNTEELDDTRFVDRDSSGNAIAVELLDVSRGVTIEGLPNPGIVRHELNQLARRQGWPQHY